MDEDVETAAEAVFAHFGLDSRSSFLTEATFIASARQNSAGVLPGTVHLFRLAVSPFPGLADLLFISFVMYLNASV